MLTILLITVAIAVCANRLADDYDRFEYTMGGIFWGFLFAVITTFIVSLFFIHRVPDVARADLANLGDTQKTAGVFFLGSGVIDKRPTYSYYVKESDGGYRWSAVVADSADYKVRIYQGDYKQPYLQTIGKTREQRLGPWLFHPWHSYDLDRVNFYIPKGSITTDFKLDAQ